VWCATAQRLWSAPQRRNHFSLSYIWQMWLDRKMDTAAQKLIPYTPRLKATKDTILMRLAVAFVALSVIWVALTVKCAALAIIGEPRHNSAQIA
jgi:hypothetical protein